MGWILGYKESNYASIPQVPRPPFVLQEDKPKTLHYLQNIMKNIGEECPIEVDDIVFGSWESASSEFKVLTRGEDNFISALKIIMPKKDLITQQNSIQLRILPQPFQIIHVVLPPQAGFNPIIEIEEKFTLSNPIYQDLDNSEAQQFYLVYTFFEEKTSPENQLRIRCQLEQMQVNISDVYWKIREEEKKIEILEQMAPLLTPPLLSIARSYLTGGPKLIRK